MKEAPLHDFRGNFYKDRTPLFTSYRAVERKTKKGLEFSYVLLPKPEPQMCEEKGCTRQAVRNPCAREGDAGRTHWHGEVHCADGSIKALCAEHGDTENAKRELEGR